MTLEQRLGFFSTQRFTILEDKLLCRVNSIGRSSEFAVGFNEMAENPTGFKQTPWVWFLVVALGFCAVLTFLILAALPNAKFRDGYLGSAIFFAFPTALAVYGTSRRIHNSIIFPTTRGNVVFRQGRPTPDQCKEFVQALQQRISESRDIKRQVARDVLNVLRHDAIIDEWAFRKACERLALAA